MGLKIRVRSVPQGEVPDRDVVRRGGLRARHVEQHEEVRRDEVTSGSGAGAAIPRGGVRFVVQHLRRVVEIPLASNIELLNHVLYAVATSSLSEKGP